MKLLLDTHVAIWAVNDRKRISPRIETLILDPDNTIYVSAVTIWEIAIKFSLAKKSSPSFSGREAADMFRAAGYSLLDVSFDHAAAVDDLPKLHGDPFDRLLVAQAMAEPLRLVTRDAKVAAYSDTTITW